MDSLSITIVVAVDNDNVANSETFVSGTVVGDYTDTHNSDDIYESIREVTGGSRRRRHSYLEHEWTVNRPFEFNRSRYTSGRRRTPYAMPWEDMDRQLAYALKREQEYRRSDHLFELFGVDAYLRLTGRQPSETLRRTVRDLATEMLARQDWAIMGPARLRTVRDRHSVFYYNLQGSATYNRWLAGAIGLTRMARRHGWENEERLGC